MSQLEIHHADGNVTYAALSQDNPLLIGSGQNCDVVLAGPGIKRIHCRIVWRDGRWRVEVAADAGGVKLGDKTVKAGTIRAGDVLGIGDCRIYMDEAKQQTKVTTDSGEIAAQIMPDDAPATIHEEEVAEPQLTRSSIRKTRQLHDVRGFWRKLWDGIRHKAAEQVQGEVHRPPGQERILGSPLVRWMLAAVLVILVSGVYFYYDYRNRTIQAHFDKAQKTMMEGNFEGAVRLYESFIEENPRHKLTSNARVQKALCEVQTTITGSPSGALGGVRKMIREQSKEPAFPPFAQNIAEVVGQIAQSLADAARDKADPKLLDLSLEAQDVIAKDLMGHNLSADVQAKLDKTVQDARDSIKEFTEFVTTKEGMDKAIADATTSEAYRLRERLVQMYGKFAENADIVDRMNKANQLDRDTVQWSPIQKNAETQPRPSDVMASMSMLDRKETNAGAKSSQGVTYAIVRGVLSAHEVSTGQLLWRLNVGIDTRTLPLPLPPSPNVLVMDTRHDELLAVEPRSGKLVWRQPLGEPLLTAPLLNRGKIYQPTGKGSLFVIDPNSGRIDGRLQFGTQRLATTPAADVNGQHLYLLGEQYVLYVLTLGSQPKCEMVYYLAQRPDSIIAAPLRLNRYLVLFENTTSSTCLGRVLLLSIDGASVEELQRLDRQINGWVHSTPAVFGNLMFVATDLENVLVYSGGPPEKADGFTLITNAAGGTLPPGTRPQAYSMYYTEKDLLVAASRVRHYDYKAEQQALTPSAEKLIGSVSQPIQRFPATGRVDALFVARHVPGSSAVYLTALDAGTLETRWEVLLGSGLLSLQPAGASTSNWVALTRSGHVFSVSATALTAGGTLDQPASRIESEVELSDREEPLVLSDGSSVYTPSGEPKRLFVRGAAPNAPVRPLELLGPLQAPIALFENGILTPCSGGHIFWMDPATGKPLADPFQPPLQPDQPLEWRGVAVTAKKTINAADSRGNIYQLELRKDPTPHLAAKSEGNLPKPIRSRIAVAGNLLCCVDVDNVLHTLDAETLAPIAQIKLAAPASLGPVAADGFCFVAAGDDELVCVNREGQEAWRHPLKGLSVTGRPLVKGEVVHFVTTNGLLRTLRMSDGSEVGTLDAEIPLSGGPIAAADTLVLIGDDGSLNVVKTPAAAP